MAKALASAVMLLMGCAPADPPPAEAILSDPFSIGPSFNTIQPARSFAILDPSNAISSPPNIDNAKPFFALPYEFLGDVQFVGPDDSGHLVEVFRVPVGKAPRDIAALDLNADGKLDLVTADTGGSTLTLLVNDENGNFAPMASIPLNMAPHHLAVADIDGDGQDELVVAMGLDAQGGLSVWKPENGSLVPLGDFISLPGVRGISSGDLDADTDVDLVVAHSGGLAILRNEKGILSLVSSLSPCDTPWAARIADLNGNGLGDIVVACRLEALVIFDPISDTDHSRSLGPTGQL